MLRPAIAPVPRVREPVQIGEVARFEDRLEVLPLEMREARRWLVWSSTTPDGRPTKMPHYPDGSPRRGDLDSPEDLSRLGTLEQALAAWRRRPERFAGLGFALGRDARTGAFWQALDLDDALDEAGGFETRRARDLFEATPDAYAERSPSGRGLHILGSGAEFKALRWKPSEAQRRAGETALEAYCAGRFMTVTARAMRDGGLADLAPVAEAERARLAGAEASRERVARKHAERTAGTYAERMPETLRTWLRTQPIEQTLATYGFEPMGERWLSPQSTSGVPGVVVVDEYRAVSFHASDSNLGSPIGEAGGAGTIFNAFDALAHFRFGNDRSAALRSLGLARNAEPAPVDTPEAPRFALLSAEDVQRLPRARWRVKGVLPQEGLAAVFGPSGCGKTFLALDLLGAVVQGREWFGHATRPCAATLVALEGQAGLRQRLAAFRHAYGPLSASLRFLLSSFSLAEPADVTDLAQAVLREQGSGGMVVIDTLNRAAPGLDENDSADMSRLIDNAARLRDLLGGLVVVVHHPGKDATRGMRGHSSLFAALDAVLEVRRDGDRREWLLSKSKDGTEGDAHPFTLRSVTVGVDDDGEAETSCVVEPSAADSAHPRATPSGRNQRIAWDAIGELLRRAGERRPDDAPASLPLGRPAVTLEAAVEAVAPLMLAEERRRATRAREAIGGLVGRFLHHEGGYLWCL